MRRLAVVVLMVISAASVLGAQRKTPVPKRPLLRFTTDTNDADAYYRLGHESVARDPRVAADAFYWAARLNPYAAHAFYGLYASMLLANPRQLTRRLDDDPAAAQSPETKRIDSLFVRALMLDPFLYRKYEHLLLRRYFQHTVSRSPWVVGVPLGSALDRAFGKWLEGAPVAIKAWAAYCEGRFQDALRDYAEAARMARNKAHLRSERGRIFYLTDQLDSALAELAVALDELRQRDSKEVVVAYASKALLEHSMAKIHQQLGDVTAAREAYGRALQEDLAFYPAHQSLGILALQQGDTTTALSELELAIQIRDDEPMLRLFYGYLLSQLARHAEAETHLVKAIELEPFYARSYQLLGHAYEAQQRRAEAIVQYETYLARAALTDGPREAITRRLEGLRAPTGGAPR
jgi:tetratricopeptide (TPR) repeat protein